MKTIQQKFAVSFSYPVHFTHNVFDLENSLLADTLITTSGKTARTLVVIDSGIIAANPNLIAQINQWFIKYAERVELVKPPMIVPGGENAKNGWSSVREIMTCAGLEHLDRQSYIISIGGGAVLDMTGFAAALVHRGIRLIRLPSTVLAQDDAGVGIKNGMNDGGAKNFAGTFAPPFAVINDLNFLKTLPFQEWINGVAEAFKVAIISDIKFFRWLCEHADSVKDRDQEVMERIVYKTAQLHLHHIATSGDPFETGSARPLDFGHWAGHRLELMSNFTLGHGAGVAIGIAIDSTYAMLEGRITQNDLTSIIIAIQNCGLPVSSELLERLDSNGVPDVLKGIEQFREHLGGELCITLPNPLGSKIEVHHMDPDLLKQAITLVLRDTFSDQPTAVIS
ncbi:MAG: 3-dehydroquinate synthase [Kiritimatiellae bacterium]|jgi:3-dehydroquinate synthase|nr:3-dehydroquinate synthase [Kiritimatiellia bacterium]